MKFENYEQAEKYLSNKQVFFRKEIADSDLKTIAESGRVHEIGSVEITRLNNEQVVITIIVNGIETTIYDYKNNEELFDWLQSNFIPVSEMVNHWIETKKF